MTVREKKVIIDCDDGSQLLQWLADVALTLYNQSGMMTTGEAKGLRMGSTNLGMNEIVKSVLKDGSQVKVLLSEDIP